MEATSMKSFLASLVLLFAPSITWAGDLRLLMFEEHGCYWCEKWDEEISAIYPKTQEGRAAPLERIDIHTDIPEDISFRTQPVYTPTFVVVKDNFEIGRIEGYPGAEFFWGLLGNVLKDLPEFEEARNAS
jgi:thioredoxin-related protein